MSSKPKLLTLRDVDGPLSPHQRAVEHELKLRSKPLELVEDPRELATYIGGEAVKLGVGEKWAVKKEVFQGVELYFVFYASDEEFPSELKLFISGEEARSVSGEDLFHLSVAIVNHMLRYLKKRLDQSELPDICKKV